MFANQCKIPKSFFRCNCGKKEIEKGEVRFEDNTGLSCSDCTYQACTNCGKISQYNIDKVTSGNIRMLKVNCENKCGETITLTINRENKSHVKNECLKRMRPCKYVWAGCTHEGAGDEIEQHEREDGVHGLAAIDKLHERIEKIEAKLNAICKTLQPSLP